MLLNISSCQKEAEMKHCPKVLLYSVLFLALALVSCSPKPIKSGDKIGNMLVAGLPAGTNSNFPMILQYCDKTNEEIDLKVPGSITVNCKAPEGQNILLELGWGAADEVFEKTMTLMDTAVLIDGHKLDMDSIENSIASDEINGKKVKWSIYQIDLLDIPPGKHVIKIVRTQDKEVDDGLGNIYPKGVYETIFNLTVGNG
jgi:hypothetical protein